VECGVRQAAGQVIKLAAGPNAPEERVGREFGQLPAEILRTRLEPADVSQNGGISARLLERPLVLLHVLDRINGLNGHEPGNAGRRRQPHELGRGFRARGRFGPGPGPMPQQGCIEEMDVGINGRYGYRRRHGP
jgi:hypothetical protein